MSGKKTWPYHKDWRGQVMRVLHHKAGGVTDGAQNIILMMRMEEKLNPIKIKNWESQTVSGCLYESVGVNQVHLRTSNPISDRVLWQWKITVVHWVVFPVGGKLEP